MPPYVNLNIQPNETVKAYITRRLAAKKTVSNPNPAVPSPSKMDEHYYASLRVVYAMTGSSNLAAIANLSLQASLLPPPNQSQEAGRVIAELQTSLRTASQALPRSISTYTLAEIFQFLLRAQQGPQIQQLRTTSPTMWIPLFQALREIRTPPYTTSGRAYSEQPIALTSNGDLFTDQKNQLFDPARPEKAIENLALGLLAPILSTIFCPKPPSVNSPYPDNGWVLEFVRAFSTTDHGIETHIDQGRSNPRNMNFQLGGYPVSGKTDGDISFRAPVLVPTRNQAEIREIGYPPLCIVELKTGLPETLTNPLNRKVRTQVTMEMIGDLLRRHEQWLAAGRPKINSHSKMNTVNSQILN